MTVLAEGIETQEQLEHLRRLRCEIGQGYFFSPAAPSGESAAMLGRVPRKLGAEAEAVNPHTSWAKRPSPSGSPGLEYVDGDFCRPLLPFSLPPALAAGRAPVSVRAQSTYLR